MSPVLLLSSSVTIFPLSDVVQAPCSLPSVRSVDGEEGENKDTEDRNVKLHYGYYVGESEFPPSLVGPAHACLALRA